MSDSKNYLDLVNAVLIRLREETVPSVNGQDDVVVSLVKEYLNDAKRMVEDTHTWSALNQEWAVDTGAQPSANGVLTGSFGNVIIDYLMTAEGHILRNLPLKEINRRVALNGSTSSLAPSYWAVSGKTVSGAVTRTGIRFDCLVDATQSPITAYGTQPQQELSADLDVLLVPSKPVIYLATAFAARERGEVGGQSVDEMMQIANRYVSDAVAQDSTNSDLDNIWTTV